MARRGSDGSVSRRRIPRVLVGGPCEIVTVLVTVTVDPNVVVVVVFVVVVLFVVVVFSIVVVVVGVVVVNAVVVSVVVFADVASASVPPPTVSISVITGGVTTENRPHFSKKARRSALCLASSGVWSVMIAPRETLWQSCHRSAFLTSVANVSQSGSCWAAPRRVRRHRLPQAAE